MPISKVSASPDTGASVIEYCYAASCTHLSATMTKLVERANTDLSSHSKKTLVDEKITLNVSRRRLIRQGHPRAGIQPQRDCVELQLAVAREVGGVRQILAQQLRRARADGTSPPVLSLLEQGVSAGAGGGRCRLQPRRSHKSNSTRDVGPAQFGPVSRRAAIAATARSFQLRTSSTNAHPYRLQLAVVVRRCVEFTSPISQEGQKNLLILPAKNFSGEAPSNKVISLRRHFLTHFFNRSVP